MCKSQEILPQTVKETTQFTALHLTKMNSKKPTEFKGHADN